MSSLQQYEKKEKRRALVQGILTRLANEQRERDEQHAAWMEKKKDVSSGRHRVAVLLEDVYPKLTEAMGDLAAGKKLWVIDELGGEITARVNTCIDMLMEATVQVTRLNEAVSAKYEYDMRRLNETIKHAEAKKLVVGCTNLADYLCLVGESGKLECRVSHHRSRACAFHGLTTWLESWVSDRLSQEYPWSMGDRDGEERWQVAVEKLYALAGETPEKKVARMVEGCATLAGHLRAVGELALADRLVEGCRMLAEQEHIDAEVIDPVNPVIVMGEKLVSRVA